MTRRAGIVVATLAVGAGIAAAAAPGSSSPDSGVSGVVRSGRACAPTERDCRRASGPVTVVIRSKRTHDVVRTVRVRSGRFRAALAPGGYTLRATGGDALVAAASADVPAHRYVVVVLRLHRVRPT